MVYYNTISTHVHVQTTALINVKPGYTCFENSVDSDKPACKKPVDQYSTLFYTLLANTYNNDG